MGKKQHDEDEKVTEKQRFAFRVSMWEDGFDTARLGIKWLGIGVVAWITYLCIKELAGQTTVASFIFAFFKAEPPARTSIWAVIAVACAGWAWVERQLRYRKVAYLSKRVQQLETLLDPKRTSSGLAPTGETNPGDKLP